MLTHELAPGVPGQPLMAWFDDADGVPSELLGGKCSGLAEMTGAGLAVPPGFAVTTVAHELCLEPVLHGMLDGEMPHGDEVSKDVTVLHDLAAKLPIDPAVESAVVAAYEELGRRQGLTDPPVAVRSSGQNEDGDEASFAGQYDTYLWVVGAEEVVKALKRVWVGALTKSTLSYRMDRKLGFGFSPMCVGVQLMVDARSAGVMFTLDPRTGDRSRVVIESSWGLGEAVVRGDVRPDRFSVNKVTGTLDVEEIGDKEHEYRFDPASGEVEVAPVDESRRSEASLSEDEVRELVALGRRVERLRQSPQDTEWAIDKEGRLFLLQVRPETVWSARARHTEAPGEPARGALECVVSRFSGGR